MKIWIFNHYAIPPDTPGITRHYDFAREFIRQGHEVCIFAAGFNHRSRKEERLTGNQVFGRQVVDGVNFIWIRTFPYYGNNWRRAANMLSYGVLSILAGLLTKGKPDLVIASSPHPLAGLSGLIIAALKGSAFIFEVRDLWPQTLIDVGGFRESSVLVRVLKVLEKLLYQKSRVVVVLLPKAADYLTDMGIPVSRVVYIPNGVAPERLTTAAKLPEDIQRSLADLKASGKKIVGYTGAHGTADNLDTLLASARMLEERGATDIHIVLVGDGAEKERLIKTAGKMGIGNLSFYNPVPKASMGSLLPMIDIAAVPLMKSTLWKYGTSKNKLFDYMLYSRPVIWAIDLPDNPVSASGCGVAVQSDDAEAMTSAIISLASMSEEQRRAIGRRGYDYVMQNHSVPVLAKRLLDAVGYGTSVKSGS